MEQDHTGLAGGWLAGGWLAGGWLAPYCGYMVKG